MNLTFASKLYVQFHNRSIVISAEMQFRRSTDTIKPEIISSEHKQKMAAANMKRAY
jgi:DUF438 domain-containing protein